MTDEQLRQFLASKLNFSFDELSPEWKPWAIDLIESAKVDKYGISDKDAQDYLLRIMYLFEWLSDGQGITQKDLESKFVSGLAVCRDPNLDRAQYVFSRAFRNANVYMDHKDIEDWHPGMELGSGRERYYKLNLAGRMLVESEFSEQEDSPSNHESDVEEPAKDEETKPTAPRVEATIPVESPHEKIEEKQKGESECQALRDTYAYLLPAGMSLVETEADTLSFGSELSSPKSNKTEMELDTETDKKPEKKKRVLTDAARACGNAYRRKIASGDKQPRAAFCKSWVAENRDKYKSDTGKPPSWNTINKALQENPEAWKPKADTMDKSADTVV